MVYGYPKPAIKRSHCGSRAIMFMVAGQPKPRYTAAVSYSGGWVCRNNHQNRGTFIFNKRHIWWFFSQVYPVTFVARTLSIPITVLTKVLTLLSSMVNNISLSITRTLIRLYFPITTMIFSLARSRVTISCQIQVNGLNTDPEHAATNQVVSSVNWENSRHWTRYQSRSWWTRGSQCAPRNVARLWSDTVGVFTINDTVAKTELDNDVHSLLSTRSLVHDNVSSVNTFFLIFFLNFFFPPPPRQRKIFSRKIFWSCDFENKDMWALENKDMWASRTKTFSIEWQRHFFKY